jgi:hypothetical protein
MPIDKDEFESKHILSDLEKSVISFLKKTPTKAYTMREIMDGINIQTNFKDIWNAILSGAFLFGFSSILNDLANCGKIKMEIINGTYYYMAK